MSKGKDLKPDTRLVAAGRRREWTQGLVNPAVWRASTILFDSVEEMHGAEPPQDGTLHYGRNGTPTSWALQELALMQHPQATLLFANQFRGFVLAYTWFKADAAGAATQPGDLWRRYEVMLRGD